MPYETLQDLPDNVRGPLPEKAQRIYKEAFNDAWDRYEDPDDRRGDDSRENVARKVAWSAVKQAFHKEGDEWVED